MKRKSNLYQEIVSFKRADMMFNVIKNNYKRKENLYKFIKYKNCYLYKIVDSLSKHNYVFDKYRIFLIKDPKYRIIMAESLNDKIVNHLVCRYIILPAIEPCLIDTNVATRQGKGSGYAFDMLVKYINSFDLKKEVYVLKIDISKYFYNIDHDVLMELVEKKIKDKDALNMIKDILDTTNLDYINRDINNLRYKEMERVKLLNISDKEKEKKYGELNRIPLYKYKKGLPIGNMTSQTLAIYYLNEVDYYIKEVLKFKCYIRYMDDLVIIDDDKERLKEAFGLIVNKIREYKLEVNDKSNLYRLSRGINFLGYNFKINKGRLLIRYCNATIRRVNKNLKRNKNKDFELYLRSKDSYKGYFNRCNTKLYKEKYRLYENKSIFSRYKEIVNNYKDFIVFVKHNKHYYTYYLDIGKAFGLDFNKFVKIDDVKWKYVSYNLNKHNIKYIVYAGNSIEKFNSEGSRLNMEQGSKIVLRKNGNFYKCYDNDALILAYLFDYRIVNGSVGFPKISIEKIKKKLDENKIDYILKDSLDDVDAQSFEQNNYDEFLKKGIDKYRKVCLIEEINNKLMTMPEDKIIEFKALICKENV